jgi:hypothetical protein
MRAAGKEAKRSDSGQAAAKARRTRLAISTTRAPILSSLRRSVANSALPGAPYDGHTLGVVAPDMQAQIGAHLERIVGDRGYLSAMRSIVATAATLRPSAGSRSPSPAGNGAAPRRSNASCAAAPRSSRASAI